nr:MAG TPA: hypothetical protein [Caudoviricetes sp.]
MTFCHLDNKPIKNITSRCQKVKIQAGKTCYIFNSFSGAESLLEARLGVLDLRQETLI